MTYPSSDLDWDWRMCSSCPYFFTPAHPTLNVSLLRFDYAHRFNGRFLYEPRLPRYHYMLHVSSLYVQHIALFLHTKNAHIQQATLTSCRQPRRYTYLKILESVLEQIHDSVKSVCYSLQKPSITIRSVVDFNYFIYVLPWPNTPRSEWEKNIS